MNNLHNLPPSPRTSLIMVTVSAMFLLTACNLHESTPVLRKETLQSGSKLENMTRLATMVNNQMGMVCVLFPYQDSLVNDNPESSRVNMYLRSIDFTADESHWGFIFVNGDSISISRFKRSSELDILAPHEITSEYKVKLPFGFEPAICIPIEQAVVFKTKIGDRIYIIIGRTK